MECKATPSTSRRKGETVLIETLWNVKRYVGVAVNLIEKVLIETLWNVKESGGTHRNWQRIVLIETLWNVKEHRRSVCRARKYVLIETLWNVKEIKPEPRPHSYACFNRNIVECKEKSSAPIAMTITVLIETLWNVKQRFVRLLVRLE